MTVGVGIIGAGIMGERLLRAAAEHAADVVHVTGVWDPDPAALDRVGAALPGAPRAASAEALIGGADCVYVASPPGSHLGHARAALAAGKAVFLEKPLATDVADARAFVAGLRGARVAVNFPFASSPAVARLREWMEDGVLGAPRGFEIAVSFAAWPRPWQAGAARWLDARAEGGFVREVASHFLFLSRRLLGPLALGPSTVAFPLPERAERQVRARLTAGGLPGTLDGRVGGTQAEDSNRWTVRGVGSVRLRDWSIAERMRPDGSWHPDPDAVPNERQRPLVLRAQLEGVARLTRGEPHRLATPSEAFEVQEFVEAVLGGPPMPEILRRE